MSRVRAVKEVDGACVRPDDFDLAIDHILSDVGYQPDHASGQLKRQLPGRLHEVRLDSIGAARAHR